MKKTIGFCSVLLLSAVAISTEASANTGGEYESNGGVQFIPNNNITSPVNPIDPDPGEPVKPIDPVNPEGPNPGTNGPLSIDYASSFDFGINRISNRDETYYARAQFYHSDVEDAEALITPNYVQVTDNRGTNAGWTLTVKQNGQFYSEEADYGTLDGSQITLTDSFVNSNAAAQVARPETFSQITLDPNGAISTVMAAKEKSGAGTWVNGWGEVETITEKNEDNDDVEAHVTKAVSLSVPGSTPKEAVVYRTTLSWNLTDAPLNGTDNN